jgi:predicted SAM-dependent methyltransferase
VTGDRLIARVGGRFRDTPGVTEAALRLQSAPHWARRGHLVRRRRVAEYLAGADRPRLHLGSGPRSLSGWLDSDLVAGAIYLDVTRHLPFPDASLHYVYGEHVIEHVSERAARRLLAEALRVLRPGGVLRLTTPDVEKLIAMYEGRGPIEWREYAGWLAEARERYTQPAQLLNDQMRLWGHRYVYDEADLTQRLREAGFSEVRRYEPGESDDPLLAGIDGHGGGNRGNLADAMSLEARR